MVFELKRKIIILLFLLIVSFFSFNNSDRITGRMISKRPVFENFTVFGPYFSPSNYSKDVFLGFLENASESLYCALYDIKDYDVVNVLNKKYFEGVDVKVVSDFSSSLKSNSKIKDLKMDVVLNENSNGLMHNKFCISDGNKVLVGSLNPTYNGFYLNDNNFVIIKSSLIYDVFRDEFFELYRELDFGKGAKSNKNIFINGDKSIGIYFCPEDNCEKELINEILNSEKSIYFEAFSFTDNAIAQSIINSEAFEIKGILESRGISLYSEYDFFVENNVSVIKDKNKNSMHNKVIIIDNSTVIMGSPNFSNNGMNRNDESMIIIHDVAIASKYVSEFFRLWREYA